MSLILGVYLKDAILLASDRRVTYETIESNDQPDLTGTDIHYKDNADKTYLCSNGSGISSCGNLSINGVSLDEAIAYFIKEWIKEDTDVTEIPEKIIEYFKILTKDIAITLNTTFIVGGFSHLGNQKASKVYRIFLNENKIEEYDTSEQNCIWGGEVFLLERLMFNCAIKDEDGYTDVPDITFNMETYDIQKAIDFCKFAITSTVECLKFLDTIQTVGGNIDILMITPTKTQWIQKTNK